MTPKGKKVAVIGAGIMGTIIIDALFKFFPKKDICIYDVHPEKLRGIKNEHRSVSVSVNASDLSIADYVVLAIKPQDFSNFKAKVKSNAVAISIMAGVSTSFIKKQLGVKKVIRAMPNAPARYGQGFTVWLASNEITRSDKLFAKKLFGELGVEREIKSEGQIAKVTAVTGSGPAYIFSSLQSYLKAVEALGFDQQTAHEMIMKVLEGALAMLKNNGDFNGLIKQIASKGGTTEAALKQFKKDNLDGIWQKAILVAYRRAKKIR